MENSGEIFLNCKLSSSWIFYVFRVNLIDMIVKKHGVCL